VIDLRLLGVEEPSATRPADVAARLRRACGHTAAGAALLDAGFRFYPMPGGDLPPFLNRRLTLPDGRVGALTLVAGIDAATGEAVLEGCRTQEEARRTLAQGPTGTWLIRLTLGNRSVSLSELTTGLPHADPVGFGVFARALDELPLLTARACPLCSAA
jgi:hypothetical protein